MGVLTSARTVIRGNYALLVISNGADEVSARFEKALKKAPKLSASALENGIVPGKDGYLFAAFSDGKDTAEKAELLTGFIKATALSSTVFFGDSLTQAIGTYEIVDFYRVLFRYLREAL